MRAEVKYYIDLAYETGNVLAIVGESGCAETHNRRSLSSKINVSISKVSVLKFSFTRQDTSSLFKNDDAK